MNRPAASPVHAVRARLGALRRRIHALFALQGLGRLLAALVGLLALYFLADWLLDLPLGVRRFVRLGLLDRPDGTGLAAWVALLVLAVLLAVWASRNRLGAAPLLAFLAGGLLGLSAWLAWRFLGPAGLRLTDEALALSVERRYRSLNDRLAAALDFDRELAAPTRGESQPMMERVVAEAAEEAKHLEFARAVSGRRALVWLGTALASVVLGGIVVLAMGDTVGLWAKRSLLLEDTPWPRRTNVLAVDLESDGTATPRDPALPYEVAVGRPLVVNARVEGRVPDEVVLLDRVAGARPIPRRLFALPGRPGLFAVEIRDVRRGFDFVLRAGDDDDDVPRYRVETVVPPRLLDIRATLSFPDYLALPDETLDGGNATVPEGTRVALEVVADTDVVAAELLAGDARLAGARLDGEGVRFGFDLLAEETLRYRIRLKTASGRESDPAADSYEIRVEPDRAPRTRWIHPEGAVDVTANARVPLLAEVTDDHGLSSIVLEVRLPGDEVRRHPVRPFDADDLADDAIAAADGRLARETVRVYHALEIAEQEAADGALPAPPSRLAARLVVTDSKGQTDEGPWTHFDVFASSDLERSLGARRGNVRASFEVLLDEQRSRREQLALAASGTIGESERDALRSLQYAQAKLAQDIDEATRDLADLFNGWILNRLGAEGPTEKILVLLDRHHRRSYGRPTTDADEEAGAARAIELGDPVFPYALYDEIARARRERVIFDTGLVDRMLQALEPAVDAAARRAPVAHDLVRRVAADEADAAAALAAQDAVIAALEATLEGMSSWKRLGDVIQHLRRILEQQTALDERLQPEADTPPRRSR